MITIHEAVDQADWKVRYAIDRLDGSEHPGLRHTLIAAEIQLRAAITLAQPQVSQEA